MAVGQTKCQSHLHSQVLQHQIPRAVILKYTYDQFRRQSEIITSDWRWNWSYFVVWKFLIQSGLKIFCICHPISTITWVIHECISDKIHWLTSSVRTIPFSILWVGLTGEGHTRPPTILFSGRIPPSPRFCLLKNVVVGYVGGGVHKYEKLWIHE